MHAPFTAPHRPRLDSSIPSHHLLSSSSRRPQIRLFKKGSKPSAPLSFSGGSGDFSDEDLVRFVKSEAGVYMGLQGTLEAFEKLAEEFVAAAGKAGKEGVLARAEKEAKKYSEAAEAEAAKYYVKTMQKIQGKARAGCDTVRANNHRTFLLVFWWRPMISCVSKQADHAEAEHARLAKVKDSARAEKKAEFERKQNVLSSFVAAAKK